MTTSIHKILSQYPTDNSKDKPSFKQPPIDAVDRIVDALVREYDNPGFRRWYCGVVYEFGPAQFEEWRRRASEGKEPAKLFSKYVKEARTYSYSRKAPSER